MKDKEIEIQVQVEDSKKLFSFLKKSAKFIGQEHQVDTYYSPQHRNFIKKRPIKEWLRLRKSSKGFSINYKNWHYDKNGRSNYCDEYESKIESIESVEKIIKALNVKELVVVDKLRKIWKYKDYEISMDSVKKLGDFVEIEYKGKKNTKKPSTITKEMIDFIKEFNPGRISRNYVGYPFQILFPKEVEYEIY